MYKILILEVELSVLESLDKWLKVNDYSTIPTSNVDEAIRLFNKDKPDAALITIEKKHLSGFELIEHIRESNYKLPIFVLSCSKDILDQKKADELMINEFYSKPYHINEFKSKLQYYLEKNNNNASKFKFNDLEINQSAAVVKNNGKIVNLSKLEFKILTLLAKNEGAYLDNKFIIKKIWNDDFEKYIPTLRNEIYKLRKKIEKNPNNPTHIISKRDFGYMLRLHL